MHNKLHLTVTVDNEELIDQELKKAVEAYAKTCARSVFEHTLHKETDLLIQKRLNEWDSLDKQHDSTPKLRKLRRTVNAIIDKQLEMHIKDLTVNDADIQEHIDKKLDLIQARIDECIIRKCNNLDLEAIIRDEVANQCKLMIPAQLLQIFTQAATQPK